MGEVVTYETPRLRIRPLCSSDAESIHREGGNREIADTMISLPHPFPLDQVEQFIARMEAERENGEAFAFVIELKNNGEFVGCIEIRAIDREHKQAEISSWTARPFWGQGYMTEVVGAILPFAFDDLGMNRVYAFHMVRNPATGRVLQKNGFRQEGLLRQRVWKWDRFENVAIWAILKGDVGGSG